MYPLHVYEPPLHPIPIRYDVDPCSWVNRVEGDVHSLVSVYQLDSILGCPQVTVNNSYSTYVASEDGEERLCSIVGY